MFLLKNLQKAFLQDLYTTDTPSLIYIKTHTELSPEAQMIIYRHSVIGRFQKTLASVYPVCDKLVGTEFFMAMTYHYILKTPSLSPMLINYGLSFANFIAEFEPARSLPYLADMARLEWAIHRLETAPYGLAFNFQKLQDLYQQGIEVSLTLPPQACLIQSSYPIHRIWEMNQPDISEDEPPLELNEHSLYSFLIWRNKNELRLDLLNDQEWFVLSSVDENMTLSKISEQIEKNQLKIKLEVNIPACISKGWLLLKA